MNTLEVSYKYGSSLTSSIYPSRPLQTYLIGWPIAHSLAPIYHGSVFASLDVPCTYQLVESKNKNDILPLLRSPNCLGTAITMPHKVAFMSEVDDLTEEGRVIGAINTVFVRLDASNGQRRYIGTNTDCIGIREAFVANVPDVLEKSRRRPALVIGAGGACRGAIYALSKWMGSSRIYLVNRLKSEVDEVIGSFSNASPALDAKLTHVSTVEQAKSIEAPFVIVGTIPDLPANAPGEMLVKNIVTAFLLRNYSTTDRSECKGHMLEMCYHPIRMALYNEAQQLGWNVIPGTEALIYGSLVQQVLWMEKSMEQVKDVGHEAG